MLKYRDNTLEYRVWQINLNFKRIDLFPQTKSILLRPKLFLRIARPLSHSKLIRLLNLVL